MMEHSPSPEASAMMEHSASPDASAMMEHSPSPAAAAPVASGTFHKVDGSAEGTAALFHNADGTFTITFEDFSIDSAANTHVVLVTRRTSPRTATSTRPHWSTSERSRGHPGCRTSPSRRRPMR